MKIDDDVRERFWDKVDRRGEDDCWEWTAAKNSWGYGQLRVDGQMEKAHRVSWVLHNGPIPDGLCVLHRCDNPPCTNPAHLFLGTRADNAADREAKGRGHEHTDAELAAWYAANLKVSDEDVRAIRREYADGGVTYAELAEKWDISEGHVGHIVNWDLRVAAGGVGRPHDRGST